ncbi:MAG: type II toxin-antitoxin system CcdA family antitoxin [Beijerinckiaceae bacterium]
MAGKKAVNLNFDADLLAEARAENVKLSAVAERAVREELANIRAERWKRENAEAIRHNNEDLERNGLWSDGYRLF